MLALCKLPFFIADVELAFKGASITIDTKLSDVGLREGDCIDVIVNGAMQESIPLVMEVNDDMIADLSFLPQFCDFYFLAHDLATVTILVLQFGTPTIAL